MHDCSRFAKSGHICYHVYHTLANKRKSTIPPKSQAKKFKADSANKDEIDNQQQRNDASTEDSTKKKIEYQTNIAVCEVQLEELKYVCVYCAHQRLLT